MPNTDPDQFLAGSVDKWANVQKKYHLIHFGFAPAIIARLVNGERVVFFYASPIVHSAPFAVPFLLAVCRFHAHIGLLLTRFVFIRLLRSCDGPNCSQPFHLKSGFR